MRDSAIKCTHTHNRTHNLVHESIGFRWIPKVHSTAIFLSWCIRLGNIPNKTVWRTTHFNIFCYCCCWWRCVVVRGEANTWMWPVRVSNWITETSISMCVDVIWIDCWLPIQSKSYAWMICSCLNWTRKKNSNNFNRMSQTWCSQWND